MCLQWIPQAPWYSSRCEGIIEESEKTVETKAIPLLQTEQLITVLFVSYCLRGQIHSLQLYTFEGSSAVGVALRFSDGS